MSRVKSGREWPTALAPVGADLVSALFSEGALGRHKVCPYNAKSTQFAHSQTKNSNYYEPSDNDNPLPASWIVPLMRVYSRKFSSATGTG